LEVKTTIKKNCSINKHRVEKKTKIFLIFFSEQINFTANFKINFRDLLTRNLRVLTIKKFAKKEYFFSVKKQQIVMPRVFIFLQGIKISE